MKAKGLLCNISTLFTLYATIRNIRWKPPGESHQFQGTTAKAAIAMLDLESMENHTFSQQLDSSSQSLVTTFSDTTIIITSSYIPSHPSTEIIDRTIDSLEMLQDLQATSAGKVPLIITVDGPNRTQHIVLKQYIDNLHKKYHDHTLFNLTILPQKVKVKLIKNIQRAMPFVQTKFLYVLQHDLPFMQPVNHSALVQTFRQYPETVRLVRFGLHPTLSRHRDIPRDDCHPFVHSSHDIDLTKTHTWSDNNHFTTKAYYEEMLSTVPGMDEANFMEVPMREASRQNCSKWGTWLYGKQGHGPMIYHLDGRHWINEKI
jgi:hypothetical protein